MQSFGSGKIMQSFGSGKNMQSFGSGKIMQSFGSGSATLVFQPISTSYADTERPLELNVTANYCMCKLNLQERQFT